MDLATYEQLYDDLSEAISNARCELSDAIRLLEKFEDGASLPIGAKNMKDAYNLLC